MLITHDLGVVAEVADRVVVMYAGQIVEDGSLDDIFYAPHHPYTWGLLGSLARLDQPRSRTARADRGRSHRRCWIRRRDAASRRDAHSSSTSASIRPPWRPVRASPTSTGAGWSPRKAAVRGR